MEVNDTTAKVAETVLAHRSWLALRRAPATVDAYARHLGFFTEWAGDRTLASVTAKEIEFSFLGPWALNVGRPSLRNRIAALRSLYDFAERYDLIEKNVMRRIEAPPRDDFMGKWLRPEDDRKLLDAASVNELERVIIYLLRYTGLRVGEARNLRWADVDLDAGHLTVTKSKTASGRRTIPLHPILIPILRSWRARRGTEFVLETRHGTPMLAQFLWRVVKRVGERVGIEGLHPHTLRRTFGSSLVNSGVRLEVVSKLLGHSSTVITEASYAQLTAETIGREVLDSWGLS